MSKFYIKKEAQGATAHPGPTPSDQLHAGLRLLLTRTLLPATALALHGITTVAVLLTLVSLSVALGRQGGRRRHHLCDAHRHGLLSTLDGRELDLDDLLLGLSREIEGRAMKLELGTEIIGVVHRVRAALSLIEAYRRDRREIAAADAILHGTNDGGDQALHRRIHLEIHLSVRHLSALVLVEGFLPLRNY